MPKKDKMIHIMVLMRPITKKKLEEFKARTGNSIASTVRTAIDEYLQRNTPTIQVPHHEK